MRIGFDAKRFFHNQTGLGNYSRTLVESLLQFYPDEEYFLFDKNPQKTPRTDKFFNKQNISINGPAGFSPFWRSIGIRQTIKKEHIDVYHGLSAELPLGLKTPSVVTIHDLIFEAKPQQYNPLDRFFYSRKARHACKHADKIIAISEATKREIEKFYRVDSSRIEVIYQTCDKQFFHPVTKKHLQQVQKKYNLPETFLLYVGSVIKRKNLLPIVKALPQIKGNTPLVVVGDTSSAYANTVKEYIKENHLTNSIHFLKNAEFSDFPAIYKLAKLLLYPSDFEGFGIPVIEALACGTPVITSNKSSLPEAAGPGSVCLENITPTSIAQTTDDLLADKGRREKMTDIGLQYVKRFQAGRLTDQLMNVYKEVL